MEAASGRRERVDGKGGPMGSRAAGCEDTACFLVVEIYLNDIVVDCSIY